MKILLASKSPRRRELMQQLRLPFQMITIGGLEEVAPPGMQAEKLPAYFADMKAKAYLDRLMEDELVITADTLVLLDGDALGKPGNREAAIDMLKRLSGRNHQVVTGVCLATKERHVVFETTTEVEFASLSEEDILYYVDNFKPYDKAGAYGIQEWIGCVAVKGIKGSYYNVMGLPVHRLYHELKKLGLTLN